MAGLLGELGYYFSAVKQTDSFGLGKQKVAVWQQTAAPGVGVGAQAPVRGSSPETGVGSGKIMWHYRTAEPTTAASYQAF